MTTILTAIAPCSGWFTTVRRRSVSRLTCADGFRRTAANPRLTAGGQGGSQVQILSARQRNRRSEAGPSAAPGPPPARPPPDQGGRGRDSGRGGGGSRAAGPPPRLGVGGGG